MVILRCRIESCYCCCLGCTRMRCSRKREPKRHPCGNWHVAVVHSKKHRVKRRLQRLDSLQMIEQLQKPQPLSPFWGHFQCHIHCMFEIEKLVGISRSKVIECSLTFSKKMTDRKYTHFQYWLLNGEAASRGKATVCYWNTVSRTMHVSWDTLTAEKLSPGNTPQTG